MKHAKEGDASYCADEKSPVPYLVDHPEVSDVLLTGGDPLIMRARVLGRYVAPLLKVESVQTIRIGTRSISWWPYRFTDDADSDELMKLFGDIVNAGKHLCIIGHISHPREIETRAAARAVARIRSTGAVIRCQTPLLKNVNDHPETLAALWTSEVRQGMVPYYLFTESDAGARNHFKVPLARALRLFQAAQQRVSGLARTVRGPVIYNVTDKIQITDVIQVAGEERFVLQYVQSHLPENAGKVILAEYDEHAVRFDQLKVVS
jgi:L-lysine 2,3-aminomutase